MSSKINVAFQLPDGRVENQAFSIRHLRNFTTGQDYRRVPNKNGGYTVLADSQGDLFISKCHPKSDEFSKKLGLFMALEKFVNCKYPGHYFLMDDGDEECFESLGQGKFKVVLHSAEAVPFC